MSASTVSITPNPASTAARRRPVEKKKSTGIDLINNDAVLATATATDTAAKFTAGDSTNNLTHTIRTETTSNRDAVVQVKKPLPNGAAPTARRASTSARKAQKPEKPKWLTFISILTKNFLLLLVAIGLVQMVRKLAVKNAVVTTGDGVSVISADMEGKFAEMESLVKKTTKMIQVQVDVIDRKLEKHVADVKGEMEVRDVKINERLNEIRENLEKELGEKAKNRLMKEEFDAFFEEYTKAKKGSEGGIDNINLDEVRVYAREIVEREIEKHAADGLGRVDYALASGGATVVKHSEPLIVGKIGGSGNWISLTSRKRVHQDAEKMLSPSFGEPGQCFPLKGSSGFVTVRLRTAIVPEAMTLEHVAKSVAYDRSSAPKDCRVSGWLQRQDSTGLPTESEKMFLLTEFSYDLEKSNAQTFNVLDSVGSSIVDTIRFDFTSNHGSSSHTCIYRLRVHGYEPSSISMQP